MKIIHDVHIELDYAEVPPPDLEDDAALAKIKEHALLHCAAQIDARHAEIKRMAREARLAREGT